jgi:hypothetical protein
VPILDAKALTRPERYREHITGRLELGESREVVAQDVALQAGPTPGQVYLYGLPLVPPPAKRRSRLIGWPRRAA